MVHRMYLGLNCAAVLLIRSFIYIIENSYVVLGVSKLENDGTIRESVLELRSNFN